MRAPDSHADRNGAPDHGQLLATVPRGDKERLEISVGEYEGKRYVSIRVWFLGRDGKTWLPGQKGVTVRARELAEAIGALQRAQSIIGGAAAPSTGRRAPNPQAAGDDGGDW